MRFSLFKKKELSEGGEIPPEMYHSIHVMQDDVDSLSGKAPKLPVSGTQEPSFNGDAGNPFLGSDSPFGENSSDSGLAPVVPVLDYGNAKPAIPGKGKRYVAYYGLITVLVLVFIGVGVYFFLVQGGKQSAPESSGGGGTQPNQTSTGVSTQPQIPDDASSYYSISKPNYLPIDVESSSGTPEGIQKALKAASDKVNGMTSSDPVEFVVTDTSNNPLAFSRFAHLLGLTLPQDMVSLVDEQFSVYMVRDGNMVKLGLTLSLSDEAKMREAVVANESKLPTFLNPLLYFYGAAVPADANFRAGKYGNLDTRFAIIDDTRNISMDYAYFSKKLVIGTSKLTFQSVLAKLAIVAK